MARQKNVLIHGPPLLLFRSREYLAFTALPILDILEETRRKSRLGINLNTYEKRVIVTRHMTPCFVGRWVGIVMGVAMLVPALRAEDAASPISAPAANEIPVDREEATKRIVALSHDLETLHGDRAKLLQQLIYEFSILDKNILSDPASRVPLVHERLRLIFGLESGHRWPQMLSSLIHYRIVAGRSVKNRPAWEGEPEVEMGNFEFMGRWLAEVGRAYPQDPEVNVWKADLAGKLAHWWESLAAANAALAKAKPNSNVSLQAVTAKAYYHKYHSLLYLDRLQEARTALAQAVALDKSNRDFQQAQRALAFAEQNKLIFSQSYQESIPLGIYHLFNTGAHSAAGSVCGFKLTTLTSSARTIVITAEIPNVTEKITQTELLLPGKTVTVRITPPLKASFDPGALRADRPSTLLINFTDQATNSSFFSWPFPVKVLPSDSLPLTTRGADNTHRFRTDLIGAWVTPNSPAVEEFLSAAKLRAPRNSFEGHFAASLPQAKALFDELKARGVTYVSDPQLFSDLGLVQRTRLPREVLASHNAQCLEGSVTFASLLEAIGLSPIVVLVPGHAFVGWEPSPKDFHTSFGPYYLETTMVGTSSFEEAMTAAAETMRKNQAEDNFKNHAAFVVKIAELRAKGITPQPNQ